MYNYRCAKYSAVKQKPSEISNGFCKNGHDPGRCRTEGGEAGHGIGALRVEFWAQLKKTQSVENNLLMEDSTRRICGPVSLQKAACCDRRVKEKT